MSKSHLIRVIGFTWKEVHSVFNPLDPHPTSNHIIDEGWCNYVLLGSNSLRYMTYLPEIFKDVPETKLTRELWSELTLLTDKLSRDQIIDYLTN